MANLILTLRQLVQEAAVAPSPRKRVEGIVTRVKAAMDVGACSLYLVDDAGTLHLAATDGLNPSSVGAISLRPGEGLVGYIGRTQHPVNLDSASEDPRYRYFPDSGEDRYEAFLGAPVVHHGKLVGVLVVEQRARRRFTEDEESFLVTVAAQLGLMAPADLRGEEDIARAGTTDRTDQTNRRLSGVQGAPGVGIGRMTLLADGSDLMTVPEEDAKDVEHELERFRTAVAATLDELAAGQRIMAESVSRDMADVFTVYDMLLRGKDFSGVVEARIAAGKTAASALRAVVAEYAARFEEVEDDYLRARGEDIRNLGSRVYGRLRDAPRVEIDGSEKVVLVGGLVSIADIAAFPAERLVGIVSMEGSALSHTAVLAKALGLPAVMGIGHVSGLSPTEEPVIVDGYQGQVVFRPSPAVLEEFRRLSESERTLSRELASLKELPAETPDGKRIDLHANTGLLADITPGLVHGAEGVGLYRSEIPFLVRDSFPSEDEQVKVYRTVLEAYQGMPVCMRTLDVGGDKPLPYYPFEEENPALGWRGVRFTLDNTAVMMTQVRAMLRASAGLGNLQIMLPMIGAVAEIDAFHALLDNAIAQLEEEGVAPSRPRVGIMVEVPAVTGLLRFLAEKIDFISIGTNDLTQYLLAVDRNNPRVAELFDHLHPGVLDAVERIVREARKYGLKVSICGEMASDPCAAVLLLAMGAESLSMSAFSIPRIKCLIRTIPDALAREQLELAKQHADPGETRRQLRHFLIAQGLGRLLEPERGEGLVTQDERR